MFKRFLIALLLLALVAGGVVGFNLFRDQAIEDFFANRPVPAVPVESVVAEAGPWVPSLEAIGTVSSARGIELSVEVAGVVREVTFQANQWVEEGEPLVRIGDEIEQAELAAAESSVALAEQTLERASSLGNRGITAAATVDEAEAALTSARAQVQRIRALIDQKVVVAPFSGEIGIPQIEEGQFVTAGTPVAALQNVARLRVDFSLPEQTLPSLEIDRPVTVTAETGASASGHITAIEPRVDAATRLVAVRAELDNEDGALRPGQFVRVRVGLPVKEEVVSLPQTAVVTSLYGDYVYAVVDSEESGGEEPQLVASQVFIRTGSRQGNRVEIVEGIEPGDRVVLAGQNRLSSGAPVTLEAAEGGEPEGTPQDKGAAAESASGAAPGTAQAAEARE